MEAEKILEILFSLENPAIYGIAFTLIIIIMTMLIKREVFNPLARRKKRLEVENMKLNALYAEIDPDPILRVDSEWNIIGQNLSADFLLRDAPPSTRNFSDLLSDEDYEKLVIDKTFEINLCGRYYSTVIKDVADLGFKQIYLHDITRRVLYQHQVQDYQKNLKELHKKVDTVHEQEKQRIAKELHDGVGHSLSLLRLELLNTVRNVENYEENEEIKSLLETIDKLSDEVRELSHQLKPRILSEFGLVPALRSLVDKVNSHGGIKGYVNQDNGFIVRDENIELTVYRICQEALNNIMKHSEAQEFFVDISYEESILKMVISDDGKGFDIDEIMDNGNDNLGLLNMQERAEAIGASFSVDSIKNMGTSIYLSVALNGSTHD